MKQLYNTRRAAALLGEPRLEPKALARRVRGAVGSPLPRYKFGEGANTLRLPAGTVHALAAERGVRVEGGLVEETHDKATYSVAEAAAVLDGTRPWVYNLISSGELPEATPPGEQTRVRREDLEAFISRHYEGGA